MAERLGDREELLASVWAEIRAFTEENVRNVPAAARAIHAGASAEELVRAMTAASYETAFSVLALITEALPASGLGRRWAANLEGLHEDLLTTDPSGLEGDDFFK